MKKKKPTIEDLLKRIIELENRERPMIPPGYYWPYTPPVINNNPNLHFHNGTACYNNPCYWC